MGEAKKARDAVADTIEEKGKKKPARVQSNDAPIGGDTGGNKKPQNTETPPVNTEEEKGQTPRPYTQENELIVEEKENNDEDTLEIDEEGNASSSIHLVDPAKKAAAEAKAKKNKAIGNVDKNFEDPDYGEPEKGKFEIKEGDIIDYMFKEIFLASCNWVGDTATGYIGLAAYRTGSWVYRHPGKWTADTFKKGWDATFHSHNDIRKDSALTDQEKNIEVKNSTTRFAKETFGSHESKMKINPILANKENIEKIIEAIGEGKIDKIAELPDEFKKKIKNMPPEILAQISADKEGFRQVMLEKATEYMVLNTFATNYATARLLNDKNKDKDAHNGQNVSALHDMYCLEGRKLMLINIAEGKDPIELSKAALEALNIERDNIKNEQYNENGKKPKENKALDKLQKMFNNSNSRDDSEEQLLEDAYGPQEQQRDRDQERRRDDAQRDVDAADADRRDHNKKPKPKDRKKDKENTNEPKEPVVISMNKGSNTK